MHVRHIATKEDNKVSRHSKEQTTTRTKESAQLFNDGHGRIHWTRDKARSA
jgi:hypothetical protein